MEHNKEARVIVTSGPTRAYFDRVRYIANVSSGALGARIVEALVKRSIPVVHIYGTGSELPEVCDTSLLEPVEVTTVDDVVGALMKTASSKTVRAVIHAMAVLDYVPETRVDGKKKSGDDEWIVRLVRTPKIISTLRGLMPDAFLVGFKLESGAGEEDLVTMASTLLFDNALDLVVANDIEKINAASHPALFIDRSAAVFDQASSKEEIAEKLAKIVISRFV
jgi:phosphopantothenoylcysteine synthetase/decarboxylase